MMASTAMRSLGPDPIARRRVLSSFTELMDNEDGLMRVIRSKQTGRYFANDDWTHDPARATNFPTSAAAIECCLRARMADVEFVLRVCGLDQDAFRATIP